MTIDLLFDLTAKSSLLILVSLACSKLWRLHPRTRRRMWMGVGVATLLIVLNGMAPIAPIEMALLAAAPMANSGSGSWESPPPSVSNLLVAIWAIGACAVLVLLVGSHLRLRKLLSQCEPVPAGFEHVGKEAGVRRPWRLLSNAGMAGPFTCGVMTPKIVLPQGWETWPEAQLRSVLMHELWHVRAWDVLVQNVALVLCSLQWFNPLVWLALAHLRNSCEEAADDNVVRGGVPTPVYAEALVAVASGGSSMVKAAALPFGARRLPERVKQILENARLPYRRSQAFAVGSFLVPMILACGATRIALEASAPVLPMDRGSNPHSPVVRLTRAEEPIAKMEVQRSETPATKETSGLPPRSKRVVSLPSSSPRKAIIETPVESPEKTPSAKSELIPPVLEGHRETDPQPSDTAQGPLTPAANGKALLADQFVTPAVMKKKVTTTITSKNADQAVTTTVIVESKN